MITGTGSIRDRHFAGIYRNASGTAAEASGTLTQTDVPVGIRSRIQVVSPFGKAASITPPNLSGVEWLKHWMSNSHQIRMTAELASEIKEELEKLGIAEASKLLTEPLRDASPAIEPFPLALIRRLGPSGSDHTLESAKANISILNTICEKFKSSPEQLRKIMFFTRWEKDPSYESPLARLAKTLTYWESGCLSRKASWLIKSRAEESEIVGELQALIKRISQTL